MIELLLLALVAHADEPWLGLDGPGSLRWGTAEQPVDALPRPRDFYLPDSGYIARNATDRPDDLEISAPPGERRFLRYVDGQLVDAWWMAHGDLPVSDFARRGDIEWQGPLLGPATTKGDDGWRAFGDAISWNLGNRTVMLWKDRASDLQILVSRSVPTGAYAVNRAKKLEPAIPSKVNPTLKGDMNRWAKPRSREISGCFDLSPKPVEANVELAWDAEGRAARIRASADQPAVELTSCVAGAVADLPALPNQKGSFSLVRLR